MTGRADPLAVMARDATHAHAYRIAHGVIDAHPANLARDSDQAIADVAALVEAARKARKAICDSVDAGAIGPGYLVATIDELAAVLKPFGAASPAEQCSDCNGSGVIGRSSGQTPESYEEVTAPCPGCMGAAR